MKHLTLETLARLVDEAPSPLEREHLQSCSSCYRELEGLKRQTDALGSLPDLRPPRGDWEMLEIRLSREGLLRGRGVASGGGFASAGWLRVAAAVVFFLSGAGVGAAAVGGGGGTAGSGELAALTDARTPEEAARAVRQAEDVYVQALSRYRELSDTEGPEDTGDPAGRYAALEGILAASRAAVREAPADPFINGILVSTLAERQATLRRISTTDEDNWF